jgi:starch synthase
MKILFCSSEVVPFAKTGGLADVSAALPVALEEEGCQVKVALPKYKGIESHSPKMGKDIEVYLVENNKYFDRDGLYGDSRGDYPDNLERFAFFCNEVLSFLKRSDFMPDIIHCNDWQSALIPIYLKTIFKDEPKFSRIKTVFTIHNLSYQGLFSRDKFPQTGLGRQLFNMHALEFYGKVNLLKGGLVFSDFITTVSPTYAKEIQFPRFGCGLDGVLRKRSKDLSGIINGLDYAVWDPAGDNKIFQKYNAQNIEDKYVNKERLQQELRLPVKKDVPLVGVVTRLAQQKGIELIISALDKMSGLDLQFVLLGTGDIKYHRLLERRSGRNFSMNLRFDTTLARKIYAGCDMFLMPSDFEPCGLGQLISLKYGTIPVVRNTGGLKDTVVNYNEANDTGNGFVFEKYNSGSMLEALNRALAVYANKEKWRGLVLGAMSCDFSWEASAKEYIELYNRALNTK